MNEDPLPSAPAELTPAEALAAAIGLPADSPTLAQALVHPSFANEQGSTQHNQRLELLGDAVLDLCVTELLFRRFPEANEGHLTRLRAQLVNTQALARWAREEGFAEALRLGRGAEAGGLRESDNVLADVVEAVIASVYLEAGHAAAARVCGQLVATRLEELAQSSGLDAKTELQQQVQALGASAPTYEVTATGGPSHARWFTVRVRLGELAGAEATGRSKRVAEQEAARLTLADPSWRAQLTAVAAAGNRSR